MNASTAMWVNIVLTAVPGIFAAWQAAGGQFNKEGAVATGAAVVGALNGWFHSVSTSQPGPLAKQ